jgi:homocitrate synthase NifV
LDVPGVEFALPTMLDALGVAEIEIVAPGKVQEDLPFANTLKKLALGVRSTGLIYAMSPSLDAEISGAAACLDHVDLIISLSRRRKPLTAAEKWQRLAAALDAAANKLPGVGVGFPNATQSDPALLLDMAVRAVEQGAARITLYDTNGSADPFGVFDLVRDIRSQIAAPIFFHGHNDLGMVTANALAAVMAGANGIDTTINGLGDRAGNCPLEPLAVALALRGIPTGILLERLPSIARVVAEKSGIPISPLAPVIGALVFSHKSPGHMEVPELFEAFDPALVGAKRQLIDNR